MCVYVYIYIYTYIYIYICACMIIRRAHQSGIPPACPGIPTDKNFASQDFDMSPRICCGSLWRPTFSHVK